MRLALFDLDYTLLPIDSDHAWSDYLCEIGVVDSATFKRENDRFFESYKAGTLNIFEYLDFALAPLAAHPRHQLDAWHDQFMHSRIIPTMTAAARKLVDDHLGAGDLCCVVTATNAFVTAPIARAFGIDHLVAVELEEINGEFTGKPKGIPSFREGKVVRTENWLAGLGLRWDSFDDSVFYSDSFNDMALLQKVASPVATNPDERLAAIARDNAWPIIHLYQ